jgi:hypothetical protein
MDPLLMILLFFAIFTGVLVVCMTGKEIWKAVQVQDAKAKTRSKAKIQVNVRSVSEEEVPHVSINESSLQAASVIQEVRIRNASARRNKLWSFEHRIAQWQVRRQNEDYQPAARMRKAIARPPKLTSIREDEENELREEAASAPDASGDGTSLWMKGLTRN